MTVPNVGVIGGTPNTGLENSNKIVRSVDPRLHFFQFDKHPFSSMLLTSGMSLVARENSPVPKIQGKNIKKVGVSNPKHEWFEDDAYKRAYNPTAAVATSDTSITVSAADDDYFRANDMLLLTNGSGQTEVVRISSVSTNTLNIVNADGTTRTAGIAMVVGDVFYRMENVRAEDSDAPAIRTTKSANQYQYLEVISEVYGLTRIKKATAHYTGDPLMEEKRKAYSQLLEHLEEIILFGTLAIEASTTNPIWHAGGLKYFLELYSNVEIRDMAGSQLTKSELDSFLTAVGKNGSPSKVALCDSRVLSAINSIGYETVDSQNFRIGEFGMNVKKVFGPMGEITLAYEPLFDQIAVFNGSMMVVDMANTEFLYLQGNGENLDIHEEDIILADGNIATKKQFLGMVAPKFTTLKHFGWLKNVG